MFLSGSIKDVFSSEVPKFRYSNQEEDHCYSVSELREQIENYKHKLEDAQNDRLTLMNRVHQLEIENKRLVDKLRLVDNVKRTIDDDVIYVEPIIIEDE